MSLELIIGTGIVSLVMAYLFIKLGDSKEKQKSHFLLQLIVLGFLLTSILLLSRASMSPICENLPVNQTITGNTTTYNYELVCNEQTQSTSSTLYKSSVWFVRVVSLYVTLYYIYELLNYFGLLGKKK